MVQGQARSAHRGAALLSELAPLVSAQRGTFYIAESADGDSAVLKFMAGYAIDHREEDAPQQLRFGQGLVGQCAREKQRILVRDVPDGYVRINSSLGSATPTTIVVLPLLFEGEVKAVVELASFQQLSNIHIAFLDQLTEKYRHRSEHYCRYDADGTAYSAAKSGAGRRTSEHQRRVAGESAIAGRTEHGSRARIAKSNSQARA